MHRSGGNGAMVMGRLWEGDYGASVAVKVGKGLVNRGDSGSAASAQIDDCAEVKITDLATHAVQAWLSAG